MFWKRRSKSFDNREYWIAGVSVTTGASLAVGFMYFCDPDRGHARRKKVADRAVSLIAQGERLVEHKAKNTLNRAEGLLAWARPLFHRHEEVPDEMLLQRVRTRLGHIVQHPQTISTTVEQGIVRLTGTVAREEKKRVLKEIRDVPGVSKVEELLAYESPRIARSIPKLLGGLAGAAVLLAVASGNSHSASRRAAA
jgi:osmotically-inducible protein OsmY